MITRLSATTLARLIRARALSPVDVVEAHIRRIEATHAALNAVIVPTFEAAREQARAAAAAIERGDPLGPLHGVPFTVKDGYDAGTGVPNPCGLASRAEYISTRESPLVARMRAAGAILLGKTNVPDNCGDLETNNLLFGPTHSPWDVSRSVGGSSGGEAAIIAAGGSPLGLASDIGGSIRLPAHFAGIVGLRPTSGLLPVEGFWPPLRGRLATMVGMGPMARRVEDVALAFDVLRGATPTPPDPEVLRNERIAFWFDDGLLPSSGAVRGAVRAAVEALHAGGMLPHEAAPPARRLARLGWSAYLRAEERQAWAQGFGNGETWSPLAEALRALQGEARVATGPLLMWLALHYTSLVAPLLRIDGARWRERLRAQLAELIGERGVAVCPVFPLPALRLDWSVRTLAVATLSSFTTWVNLAGLPALVVPVGRSARTGLPVGVQIVGGAGSEATLLAAGLVVQRALMPEWSGPVL
jgi:Asp-tRNA(Asn)/Glu-tRNA(Gln) amidotransferase A subunit family amidase